jgi:hypothetical protein
MLYPSCVFPLLILGNVTDQQQRAPIPKETSHHPRSALHTQTRQQFSDGPHPKHRHAAAPRTPNGPHPPDRDLGRIPPRLRRSAALLRRSLSAVRAAHAAYDHKPGDTKLHEGGCGQGPVSPNRGLLRVSEELGCRGEPGDCGEDCGCGICEAAFAAGETYAMNHDFPSLRDDDLDFRLMLVVPSNCFLLYIPKKRINRCILNNNKADRYE